MDIDPHRLNTVYPHTVFILVTYRLPFLTGIGNVGFESAL